VRLILPSSGEVVLHTSDGKKVELDGPMDLRLR
jgi:hypothetical protein